LRENSKTKPKKKTSGLFGMGVLLIFLFVGELFFYTWCRVQCTRMGYAITRSEHEYKKLISMRRNLKIESARLKTPERIAKTARERLGLVMPAPNQMVIMP